MHPGTAAGVFSFRLWKYFIFSLTPLYLPLKLRAEFAVYRSFCRYSHPHSFLILDLEYATTAKPTVEYPLDLPKTRRAWTEIRRSTLGAQEHVRHIGIRDRKTATESLHCVEARGGLQPAGNRALPRFVPTDSGGSRGRQGKRPSH